jgi:hypothetical protein
MRRALTSTSRSTSTRRWKAPIDPSSALIWRSATKQAIPAPCSNASASDSATASLVRRISIIAFRAQAKPTL